MIRRRLLAACLLAAPWAAQADIYKYVDEEGRVTFTNIPRKGAIKLDIETRSPKPPPSPAQAPEPKARLAPANFPRVSPEDQRRRDELRRQVLEQELAAEKRLLAQAREALAKGQASRPAEGDAASAARLQKLMDLVRLHEQNVAAIQYELSLLRR